MTIPVRDALLEDVESNFSLWEKSKWEMSPAKAEEPAKVLLRDEDETTTGSTTPPSERSSLSDAPLPDKTGGRGGSLKVTVDSGLARKHNGRLTVAEQIHDDPNSGHVMVTMWNISDTYTEQMVLEELWDGGFQQFRDFNFFYMPADLAGVHFGCCLIGFTNNAIRNEFASAFQGRPLRLAGPTALPLKVQVTSRREFGVLTRFGSASAHVQHRTQVTPAIPLNYCAYCGNLASSCRNPFHRYNV
jgi:hypothetical protein